MFRCGLLVTTALVIAGSFSFLAAQSAAMAGPVKAGVARDRNKEFMHTYGAPRGEGCTRYRLSVSNYDRIFDSSSSESGWRDIAAPLIGHGNTVHQIVFREAGSSASAQFGVYLASTTPSGLPGNTIAGGTGFPRTSCGEVRVNIPPTKLSRNTKYWIVQTTPRYASPSRTVVYWKVNRHRKLNAYAMNHTHRWWHSSSENSTSPWFELSEAPYFRLK